MLTRRPAPLWFHVSVAVACALALRGLLAAYGVADGAPGHAPPPQYAFLQFLILVGGLIWKGLEVAGKVTLEVLKWVVVNLSLVVTKIGNGLKALGVDLLKAVKRTWDFTRKLYDDILKPAWGKFWGWFDKFRRWLDDTFGPVLHWLEKVRKTLLDFWKTYVRPWLDLIDVTRKVLRVLSSLHIGWARRLDAWLGRVEGAIEQPLLFVLAKLNEVINLVNRIATLDGLLTRVALIRSLERDYIYAWRAAVNPWQKPLGSDDQKRRNEGRTTKTLDDVALETQAYMRDRSGPSAALLDEMAVVWRNYLGGR